MMSKAAILLAFALHIAGSADLMPLSPTSDHDPFRHVHLATDLTDSSGTYRFGAPAFVPYDSANFEFDPQAGTPDKRLTPATRWDWSAREIDCEG